MSVFDVENVEPFEVVCNSCELEEAINTRVNTFGETRYLEVTEGDEKNGTDFCRDSDEWVCDNCRKKRLKKQREVREKPKQGPPEPPNEWRFCQSCGEQINPTRLYGRLCENCE